MILLLHSNATDFFKATRDDKELLLNSTTVTGAFWELANMHPEELIIWQDRNVDLQLAGSLLKCFPHEIIMSSYAVENQFIPDQIEYIDQLPFVSPDYGVVYPSWRMSTDVGGIYGHTILNFENLFGCIKNFGYLLNSIAKTGQQNGLFCYSNPGLVQNHPKREISCSTDDTILFSFVAQHYKKEWLGVLFLCLWRFENKFPILSFLKSLNKNSYFKKNVSLPLEDIQHIEIYQESDTIDVIIPTFFRAEHVKNFLFDLREQSKLPLKVIIVEQDPDPNSESQLTFLTEHWPFEIIHHFIHNTGACNARNLAMESVTADFIFFADDDIRITKDLLKNSLEEMKRLGVGCINLNCLQPGQDSVFHKIKQWGAFGSGTSVVRSKFALKCKFSEVFEHGYGEDIDFGMQLRKLGCDIIYHPELTIQHLKAPIGGLRKAPVPAWEKEDQKPKPSPTLMLLVKRHYTERQIKGFKFSLFLKFFGKQGDKNPFSYWRKMERNWKKSEEWAEKLQTQELFSEKEEKELS